MGQDQSTNTSKDKKKSSPPPGLETTYYELITNQLHVALWMHK